MVTRVFLPVVCGGVLALAAWLSAAVPGSGAAVGAGEASAWNPTAIEVRGVAIQVQTNYRVLETFGPQLREIAALGANTVLFCPAGFMEHAKSQAIFVDMRRGPSSAEFIQLLKQARELGLRSVVMPMVLLSHPRGSEWRGVIEPPDWGDWWPQYREFINYYADIAREGGADMLMVGSELVSTERNRAEWLRVIEEVRGRFAGRLGYSANWDHYQPVSFWDKLDFVGMTTYNTLADKDLPSVDELCERWRPIHKRIFEFQKQVGKPLMLTEVGWCSQKGAARAPWDYYRNQTPSADGLEEQRRLYEAFIRVFDGSPGLGGVIWWEWTPGAGGSEDYGYTPKGKPAEKTLREWFGRWADKTARSAPQDDPARAAQ